MAASLSFASGGGEWKSMLEITQERLLNMLKSLNEGKGTSTYRVLVLDHRATRVLGSCLRMFDITTEGIALVESLEKRRRPFPEMEAIYIMEPCMESVSRLVKDFEDPAKPLYSRANIFFLQHCEDDVFALIKAAPLLAARVSTLVESNINYLALEESFFHLDMDDSLVRLYSSAAEQSMGGCAEQIVDRLVTFCASLNEYPFVRYNASNALCSKIANDFQNKFNTFLMGDTGFWWRGDGGDGHGEMSNRATLIVLDRAEDASVPLLHQFTYQAMVYDILNVQDNVCRYYRGDLKNYREQDMDPALHAAPFPGKDDELGIALLKDEDALWVDFRYLHITKVIARLKEYVESYASSNFARMRNKDGQSATLEEMNRVIQDLPEYQEMMEKHQQHTSLVKLCFRKLEEQKLLECAKVEQILVTGVDSDGVEQSPAAVLQQVTDLVKDTSITAEATTRILALFIVTQHGIKDAERRTLLEGAQPPLSSSLQSALLGLGYLGFQLQQTSKPRSDARHKERILEARRVAATSEDQYGRYQPKVAHLTDLICKRALPKDEYPYVIEPPPMLLDDAPGTLKYGAASPNKTNASSVFGTSFASAFMRKKTDKNGGASPPVAPGAAENSGTGAALSVRSKPNKGSAIKAANADVQTPNKIASRAKRAPKGSRVIVFIAGGATPAEMAAISKIIKENNRDVVVGTTHVLTPKKFVHALEHLEKPQEFFAQREKVKAEAKARAQQRLAADASQAGVASDAPQDGFKEIQPPNKQSKKRGLFSCGCFGGGM